MECFIKKNHEFLLKLAQGKFNKTVLNDYPEYENYFPAAWYCRDDLLVKEVKYTYVKYQKTPTFYNEIELLLNESADKINKDLIK